MWPFVNICDKVTTLLSENLQSDFLKTFTEKMLANLWLHYIFCYPLKILVLLSATKVWQSLCIGCTHKINHNKMTWRQNNPLQTTHHEMTQTQYNPDHKNIHVQNDPSRNHPHHRRCLAIEWAKFFKLKKNMFHLIALWRRGGSIWRKSGMAQFCVVAFEGRHGTQNTRIP
jgi:hypothetical protein